MDHLNLVVMTVGFGTFAVMLVRAVVRLLVEAGVHPLSAQDDYDHLELRVNGLSFLINIGSIDKEDPRVLQRALEAVESSSEVEVIHHLRTVAA